MIRALSRSLLIALIAFALPATTLFAEEILLPVDDETTTEEASETEEVALEKETDTDETGTETSAEGENEEPADEEIDEDMFFIDEDDMFDSEEETIVDVEDIIDDSILSNETGVSFSGTLSSTLLYSMNREWLLGVTATNTNYFDLNSLSTTAQGDFYIDIRLTHNFGAFLDINLSYSGQTQDLDSLAAMGTTTATTAVNPTNAGVTNYQTNNVTISNAAQTNTQQFQQDALMDAFAPFESTLQDQMSESISVKAIFFDMNINNMAYFRVGKHLIKWGSCYLWNPTDLLNAERRSFLDMDAIREGTYALYAHIPFGTVVNIYAAIDTRDAHNIDEPAVTGRFEFLLSKLNTQVSLSAWAKKGYRPVYGVDFTSTIPGIDVSIRGEASFSDGDNKVKIRRIDPTVNIITTVTTRVDTNTATTNTVGTNEVVTYAQTTNTNTVTNITTNYQTYQEQGFVGRFAFGFSRMFDVLDVEDRLMINGEVFYNMAGYDENANMFEDSNDRQTILAQGLYEPNYHGEWYGALFVSFSKFIVSDMTLTVNALGNLSDMSFLVNTGLSYNPIFNFTVSANLIAYLGEEYREFTFNGTGMSVQVSSTMTF